MSDLIIDLTDDIKDLFEIREIKTMSEKYFIFALRRYLGDQGELENEYLKALRYIRDARFY